MKSLVFEHDSYAILTEDYYVYPPDNFLATPKGKSLGFLCFEGLVEMGLLKDESIVKFRIDFSKNYKQGFRKASVEVTKLSDEYEEGKLYTNYTIYLGDMVTELHETMGELLHKSFGDKPFYFKLVPLERAVEVPTDCIWDDDRVEIRKINNRKRTDKDRARDRKRRKAKKAAQFVKRVKVGA